MGVLQQQQQQQHWNAYLVERKKARKTDGERLQRDQKTARGMQQREEEGCGWRVVDEVIRSVAIAAL